MFINSKGRLCRNDEKLAEEIKDASDEEIAALDDRKRVLRNALNAFNAKLALLPERQRQAALSLLYHQMKNLVFAFHISLEDSAVREAFMAQQTVEGKEAVIEGYRTFLTDLEATYDSR